MRSKIPLLLIGLDELGGAFVDLREVVAGKQNGQTKNGDEYPDFHLQLRGKRFGVCGVCAR